LGAAHWEIVEVEVVDWDEIMFIALISSVGPAA
jgi:hypothetical protein